MRHPYGPSIAESCGCHTYFPANAWRTGTIVAQEYLEDRAPFPHRVHMSGLVFDFLWGYAEHSRNWVDRSLGEVESWPDVSPKGKEAWAFDLFRQALIDNEISLDHEASND